MEISNIARPVNEKLESLKAGKANNNKVDIILENNDQRYLISEEKIDLKALSLELQIKGFVPAVMADLFAMDKNKDGFLEESDLKFTSLKEARTEAKNELETNYHCDLKTAKGVLKEKNENFSEDIKESIGATIGAAVFFGSMAASLAGEIPLEQSLKFGAKIGAASAIVTGAVRLFGGPFVGDGIIADKSKINKAENNVKAMENAPVTQEKIYNLAEQKLNSYRDFTIKSTEIKQVN
jgi:hypothetical protein